MADSNEPMTPGAVLRRVMVEASNAEAPLVDWELDPGLAQPWPDLSLSDGQWVFTPPRADTVPRKPRRLRAAVREARWRLATAWRVLTRGDLPDYYA